MNDDEIRQFLKEYEPKATEIAFEKSDLGCALIDDVLDEISKKFNLTEDEVEELSTRLGVGVVFELDTLASEEQREA